VVTGSKKAVYTALVGNLGIAIAKLIAAILTGSIAMLAETLHSLSDTFNQVLLLIGMKTSNLSDITNAFPELANAAVNVKLLSSTSLSDIDFILDGEVMAFQNGKPLHFQELQKRIHKKNLTEQIISETPLVYVVFDIMYFNGESLIKKSIKERKEILSSISFKEPIINSIYKFVNSEEEIIALFEKSRDIGHEGVVLKDPDSQYHPGKRGRYWVKLKKGIRDNRCSCRNCGIWAWKEGRRVI
jgi:ATP-dependent DNA ligase